MKANLHTHSYFSDGSESPETIAKMAADANIGIIALSDHNTFAGCERFAEACKSSGIKAIKAVEIDCIQSEIGFRSELLAYFSDGGGKDIQPILDRKIEARKERVTIALTRAKAYFEINDALFNYDYFHQWVVDITGYDLTCKAGVAPLYLSNKQLHQFLRQRWNIDLPDYGITQETQWWKEMWAGEEIDTHYTLYKTIRAVTLAGGYAVLPHYGFSCKLDPKYMAENSEQYLHDLQHMKSLGLWGMEIHPYRYKSVAPAINAQITRWANELGLHLTAGSDFHGAISTHNIFDGMSFDFEGVF